ncbi:TBPIP-domain-containing protein [Pluteus cervinus]|uniref:TBPIP-domain-containing protein n=2 Tax=Pluteus cervinus TaxID=181527 RepID=A0ACD3A991_9AGAR|nr:TBPIP-domain-containing protein [Pluteus cervinus]TFK62317.1 TBPIP-domain-containing protein [Pluteus cervinus]
MSSKPKSEAKVPVLKGQEAEDKVLEYIKRMNRPYGAVDVAANLKGAVPKTATQKILVALAEKGELVQKTYGKTTFFVANQANVPTLPAEEITSLKEELKAVEEENRLLAAEVKTSAAELAKMKSSPTDAELAVEIARVTQVIKQAEGRLKTLQSGTPLVSEKELSQIDTDWTKWRTEWIRRKKIFTIFWDMVTDALPPQEAKCLAEDLGIEFDTQEHAALERGPLCAPKSTVPLKRKR